MRVRQHNSTLSVDTDTARAFVQRNRKPHQRRSEMRKCEHCGIDFESKKYAHGWLRYCSRQCAGLARRQEETNPCPICGTPVTTLKANRRKTCSAKCRNEMIARAKQGRQNPNYVEPAEKAARRQRKRASNRPCARPGCNNRVRLMTSRYCSPECHYADRPRADVERGRRAALLVYVCERCGVEFKREAKRGTGRFCSSECKKAGPLPRRDVEPEPIRVIAPREVTAQREWRIAEVSCVYPGCDRDELVQRHHVVYAQHVLKAEGDLYDIRNCAGLCLTHHRAHHGRNFVVPIVALADAALEFGFELLGPAAFDYFRRYYGGHDPRLDEWLMRTSMGSLAA